ALPAPPDHPRPGPARHREHRAAPGRESRHEHPRNPGRRRPGGSVSAPPPPPTTPGRGRLGIENIVLLQVESLGTSTLERQADDGWVMPYLHDLAQQGLYFPNIIQSFCATDGSTFATATSLHRTFGPSEGVSRFLPNEV